MNHSTFVDVKSSSTGLIIIRGAKLAITLLPDDQLHSAQGYHHHHWPLARYVNLRVAHALGMPGTISLPPWISDPDMHHGTCVMHVPWYMPGSLTSGFLWSRWRGKHPDIPGACTTSNFTYLVRGPFVQVIDCLRFDGKSLYKQMLSNCQLDP